MTNIKVTVTHEFDNDDIINLLSGMRYCWYWCKNAGDFDLISVQQRILDGETWKAEEFDDVEDKIIKKYSVNLRTLKKGLKLMAEQHPDHFSDIVNETDDSTTADVLLQLSTIGEIKYG